MFSLFLYVLGGNVTSGNNGVTSEPGWLWQTNPENWVKYCGIYSREMMQSIKIYTWIPPPKCSLRSGMTISWIARSVAELTDIIHHAANTLPDYQSSTPMPFPAFLFRRRIMLDITRELGTKMTSSSTERMV
jgi:hypothetical protein